MIPENFWLSKNFILVSCSLLNFQLYFSSLSLKAKKMSISSSTWELIDHLSLEVMMFKDKILTFEYLEG